MDKKLLFDEVVLDYEKRRPKYCHKLFEDIMNYANIDSSKYIVEVGCGTGQATEPFLNKKCKVVAIEVGENLAEYTKVKFSRYKNLEVINTSFEDYTCCRSIFDLLYSATAFHWIPAEIGYKKAFDILKSNGVLALFWNRPSIINDENNLLYQNIQTIYDKYFPKKQNEKTIKKGIGKYTDSETIYNFGFTDVQLKLYNSSRVLNGEEYIELLNTYSDHRALEDKVRALFFKAIKQAITEHDNRIYIYDTIELYLAKKP